MFNLFRVLTIPLLIVLSSTAISAKNCTFSDPYNVICDFAGVAPGSAIQELSKIMTNAQIDQVARQAAQQMLPFLNDTTVATHPEAALAAYVTLGDTIREDDYWEEALAIIVAGLAAAPTENREYLDFLGRYMHVQRMAGEYELVVQAATATYGNGAQPQGGRQLQGFGTIDMQRHDGHVSSIRLLEFWEKGSPLESEFLILEALGGDPDAQFLVGRHLVEAGDWRGLNMSRVTLRTGHFEQGPYDADRGVQFLEAALAAGVAEAGPVLKGYRREATRIVEEERLASEAAAAEQAERDRIALKERDARAAEAAERAAEIARNGMAMDQYLREQNTHVNRMGIYWNSCVAEAGNTEIGQKYCDCTIVRTVEMLGQERANVALATGVGISQSQVANLIGFCVDLSRP